VLTHELVHVVRFGQQLQRVDLAEELRPEEEMRVEKTSRTILSSLDDPEADRLLATCLAEPHIPDHILQ